jgi:L-alanine-DL-glutamate epimerase-like enolase superfamily enzyme
MEVLFYDLVTDDELAVLIGEARSWLGDDITMMLDFGYRWRDWRAAHRVLERVAEHDVYLAEAPLHHDDLVGHARLVERSPIRIGGAEFAATRFECREWLETGRVDVLQPDINRCGGLTEIRRIAALAELHGATVIPHGWKTGITAAAQRHYQAATANAPYVEMFHPALFASPLRAELTGPEPLISDGRIGLPSAPGLGVELDEEAVERYRVT